MSTKTESQHLSNFLRRFFIAFPGTLKTPVFISTLCCGKSYGWAGMAHLLSAIAYVPPHIILEGFYIGVIYTYNCRDKLHIFCICTNGVCVLRSSVSALSYVSAVREHCANTNRYNTTQKLYAVRLTKTYSKQQTSCSTVLQEKPSDPQPVSKYGTGMFIAVCTKAQHSSLFWTRSIQQIPNLRPLNFLRTILILYFNLRLRSSGGFLPSCCPPKIYSLYFKHV